MVSNMTRLHLPTLEYTDQSSLETNDSLLRVFEDIHNHIYANDGLSPEQALDETIKVLFLKIFDEKNKKFEFKISSNEYKNIVEGMNDSVFSSRISNLQQETFNYFSNLFEKGEKIKLKSSTLGFVVNKLQNIDLLNSSNDVKGLAFQKFIHTSQRVGRGQFFTPDQVIKLCVEIIQPKANEIILDPTCGSGGFLSSALKYVSIRQPNLVRKFAKENIYGIEINRTAAKIAKMRMILDGDGFSNIAQCDSLSDWSSLDFELNRINNKSNKTHQNLFDVILTNPPFGTQGKITDKSVLRNFELGYKWNETDGKYRKSNEQLNGQVPEILFIERCLQFLKPGGRMAMILPNGDFENSSLTYLRHYIADIAEIFAVIKLPQETFIPSGTGVKTSIIFLRKKNGKKEAKKIFFGQITKLGYSGNKNGSLVYKKDEVGNTLKNRSGGFQINEDITDIISAYLNFQNKQILNEQENSFLVNKSDISYSRLDFEFYKPSYRKKAKTLSLNGAIRLGDLVKIKKSKSQKLQQKDQVVKYIELSDVSTQYNEIINSTEMVVHELPSRASYEIEEGQIITSVAGNSIGTEKHASALVTEEYEGFICTNGFRVLIPNKKLVNPYYLLYYFKSKDFLDQIFRFRTGAAIPSILDIDLLNVLILLPSINEQNRIGAIIEDGFKERKQFQEKISKIKVNI